MSEQEEPLADDLASEDEDDIAPIDLDAIRSAITAGSDWTTETILRQMNVGNIDLDPQFQRRDVWSPRIKSEFIESIFLNLPIPQIVLAAKKDDPNTFMVLDGKQRLLALRQFAVNPEDDPPETESDEKFKRLRLTQLSLRADLNGKSLSDLPSGTDRNAFDNHTIRTVVIRSWPDEAFLYRVFLRLNTGSTKLSPQELRQALKPGPFTSFIDKYALDSSAVRDALRLTKPDRRMADTEILIRHLAFSNFLEEYTGSLSPFLDGVCQTFNTTWAEQEPAIRIQLARCEEAIAATINIWGSRDAFTRWRSGKYERPFNRAVFDLMTFYFRDANIAAAADKRKTAVKKAFQDLCDSDALFTSSISSTTKTVGAIAYRINRWGTALAVAVKTKVEIPQFLVDRSEEFAVANRPTVSTSDQSK
jgi:hypothetical protein